MKIHFVHGWGFHSGIWNDIAKALGAHDLTFTDLNFLEDSPFRDSPLPENALYVGHSLGVLWLLKNMPQEKKGLISIAGFDCFHCYTTPAVLRAIQQGLGRNAERQMHWFWQACGILPFCAKDQLVPDRLAAGLDWLGHWDAREEHDALSSPTVALACRDDAIVQEKMSKEIWRGTELKWSESGGHALPLTQPDWCAREIMHFTRKLEP